MISSKTSLKGALNAFLFITKDLFAFSLIFYLILFILETIFPGFVSNNFNLNWALGVVVLLGIVFVLSPAEGVSRARKKSKISDWLISIFLGILGGALIFYQIQLVSTLRIITAAIGGMLIVIISLATIRP